MRVIEYPRIDKITDENVILIDGPDGTKIITLEDFRNTMLPSEMHRNIFRGNSLGTSVSVEQLEAIQSGTFDDLFIGDYWTISGFDWEIADMNYWLHCGDQGQGLTSNHLVIVPRQSLYSAQMNPTNVTTGAYAGSVMRATNLNQARTLIQSAFPNMVLTKRAYFPNAVTSGIPSAGAWMDSIVDLMSEVNVYGTTHQRPGGNGTARNFDGITIDRSQLSLFRLKPDTQIIAAPIRTTYWLRDVVTASIFACVSINGNASSNSASHFSGVRPCFAIG